MKSGTEERAGIPPLPLGWGLGLLLGFLAGTSECGKMDPHLHTSVRWAKAGVIDLHRELCSQGCPQFKPCQRQQRLPLIQTGGEQDPAPSHSYCFLTFTQGGPPWIDARFPFDSISGKSSSMKFRDKETVPLTQLISLINACVFMGHLKHTAGFCAKLVCGCNWICSSFKQELNLGEYLSFKIFGGISHFFKLIARGPNPEISATLSVEALAS